MNPEQVEYNGYLINVIYIGEAGWQWAAWLDEGYPYFVEADTRDDAISKLLAEIARAEAA